VGCEKEEQSVSGNVEIEVNKAMDEKTETANKSGQLEGDHKSRRRLEQTPPGLKQPNAEERCTKEAAKNPSLGKSLQIVVVGMIDDLAVVESLIPRIDCLESSQTSAQDRMVQKNVPTAVPHGESFAVGDFQGLHG
jgi:hypothetical protein